MNTPSLRQLAHTLGVSHTTVSEALRGSQRVHPDTRARVMAAAREAGYSHNPLAGALMSELRRSRSGTFRGLLAILDFDGPGKRPEGSNRYHRELTGGAVQRAESLGFRVDHFSMEDPRMSLTRLDGIFQSRGIRGIFLLPVMENPDFTGLDWAQYAGVYTDYIISKPALHTICSDHYRSILLVLEKLHELGFRRPGLVMQKAHDERLLHRWEAGYYVYESHQPEIETVPALLVPELTRDAFVPWFRQYQPDVVLCHRSEVIDWMEICGARVPESHGFCCLNVITNERPCAGLDLQAHLIGARGMEILVGPLYRNEYGIPRLASMTNIPAVWVEGPTLQARELRPLRRRKAPKQGKIASVTRS